MDTDGSGSIDKDELIKAFASMGNGLIDEDLLEEAHQTFRDMDENGDGQVSQEEFLNALIRIYQK